MRFEKRSRSEVVVAVRINVSLTHSYLEVVNVDPRRGIDENQLRLCSGDEEEVPFFSALYSHS